MGSQRVGHDWATELNWTELRVQWGVCQAWKCSYMILKETFLFFAPPTHEKITPLTCPILLTLVSWWLPVPKSTSLAWAMSHLVGLVYPDLWQRYSTCCKPNVFHLKKAALWKLSLLSSAILPNIYHKHSVLLQFRCSVVSDSSRPHRLQHARPPCSSPTPGVYSNSCPFSRWCHPTISSSVVPFSFRFQSFPASRSLILRYFSIFPSIKVCNSKILDQAGSHTHRDIICNLKN